MRKQLAWKIINVSCELPLIIFHINFVRNVDVYNLLHPVREDSSTQYILKWYLQFKNQKIIKQKVGSSCNEKYKLSKKCPTIGVPN